MISNVKLLKKLVLKLKPWVNVILKRNLCEQVICCFSIIIFHCYLSIILRFDAEWYLILSLLISTQKFVSNIIKICILTLKTDRSAKQTLLFNYIHVSWKTHQQYFNVMLSSFLIFKVIRMNCEAHHNYNEYDVYF